ncbi:MAG: S8 family serine peptidase [bacterium]|nr:S8 family serine peptidase [bacterium]
MGKKFYKVSASILLVSKNVFAGILLASSFILNAQDFAKGTLIVKFAPEVKLFAEKGSFTTGIESIDKLASKYGIREANELFKNYKPVKSIREVIIQGKTVKVPSLANIYKLTLDENADVLKAVKDYRNMPGVVYAEPNYIAHACATPNDIYFGEQVGKTVAAGFSLRKLHKSTPNDTYFGEQWGLTKIHASAAWDTTTGDSSVIIGILDTGIDTLHPDLIGNVWAQHGWNFIGNNNNIYDDAAGHGTHCAGTIGAIANNTIGVAGVCWKCKLLPVKVLDNNGSGSYDKIAQGITYAADSGAKVINMSLGGYAFSSLWQDALTNAYAKGAVLVAAAGNDAKSDSFYPACFPMVLAVSATDSNDKKWDGSNYGSWVDISAPGVAIYNTVLDSNYKRLAGTSCAAPFVSGVAALVASHNPTFSPGAIMNMLTGNTESIDSLNPAYTGKLGSGRLNAYLAITGDLKVHLAVIADTTKNLLGTNIVPSVGDTVNLVVTLLNNGMDANGVSATLHTDDIDITVLDSTADFGNALAREKVSNSVQMFKFSVSDTCPQHNVLFKLYLTANDSAYQDTVELSLGTSNTKNVTGAISINTIWKRGTYVVTGKITVNSGITLTIEPGTEVRLDSAKTIVIQGILNAVGTSTDSIIFTRNSPDTTKRWGYLWLKPLSKGNFKYCRIEYSGQTSAISCEGDSLYVGYSTISYNAGPGINTVDTCDAIITHNMITHNEMTGLAISGPALISYNTVSYTHGGGITAGNSPVIIYNTVSHNSGSALFGGGSAVISYNKISYNAGAVSTMGSAIITYNTISNNCGGIAVQGTPIISHNIFAYNFTGNGGTIWNYGASPTISYNTIIDTTHSTIYASGSCGGSIHNNNILTTGYAMYNNGTNSIPADSNWWGTTNTLKIDSLIYDSLDDESYGMVNYTPYFTHPSRSAPPYLDSVRVNFDVVSVETLKVYLTFSKPMNTSIAPAVSFSIDTNLTRYTFAGIWADSMHWNGYYFINEMVPDSIYKIRVSDAYDDSFLFPIPVDNRRTFRVYTAGSVSKALVADNVAAGVKLSWHHPSITNLLGYNVYRDTVSGGQYLLVNSKVITDTNYVDTTMPLGKTSYYVYTILDNNFKESSYSSEASCFVGVEENSVPKVFALSNPNPNPFTNHSTLMYQLPVKSNVSLRLFDLTGRCIKTLVDETKIPGYYKIDLKSKDYPAGIYFAKFKAGGYNKTKKLVLMK